MSTDKDIKREEQLNDINRQARENIAQLRTEAALFAFRAKLRFDALLNAGFTPDQALHICKWGERMTITWSKHDELMLEDLIARKAEVEETLMQRLRYLAQAMSKGLDCDGWGLYGDDIPQAFVDHAEAIRDALAPFDSGTRAA